MITSIFATTAAGLRMMIYQASTPVNAPKTNQEQTNLPPAVLPVRNLVANTLESEYNTIPLEDIKYSLQGTDPRSLTVNAFYNIKSQAKTNHVEVVYPQPNQALVTISEVRPVGDSVEVVKYRARLSTFGRSLLVSSPPLWQIIWGGYKKQCSYRSVQHVETNQVGGC